MSDWRELSFFEAVRELPRRASVPKGAYQAQARFPVVDQGSRFIAGFTDDVAAVVREPLPMIVFGDHTRIFKYVDFPFAPGADGTKLLTANTDVADPHFLFFALLNLGIPNRGYNRHFKYLKETVLLAPSDLREQCAIASVLSKIRAAVEVQERHVEALGELKAATMAKFFREGLHSEPLKQTEIGEIPVSWDVGRFGDFATLQRGYDLPVQTRQHGNVPVIGSNGVVGFHDTSMVNGPGVVTGRSGTMGVSHYSADSFWPLNTVLFVVDFHGNIPLFVHYAFQRFDFRRFAAGASVPTLNRNLVHEAPVAVPRPAEQELIAGRLMKLDQAVDTQERRLALLTTMFSSALHLIMTGQVRLPLPTERA